MSANRSKVKNRKKNGTVNNRNNRNNVAAQSKNGKRRKKKISKRRRLIRRIAMITIFVILLVVLVVLLVYGAKFRKYQKEADRIVREGGIAAFKQNQTGTLYDSSGNVIAELSGSHDAYYIEDADIPQYVKDAFITTEDRRFYSHAGVDLKALVRAFVELVRNKGEITQGGSTITQQLARNVFLSHEVSMDRKVKEMFIARAIEKRYSKKQILEFYINNINFGNGFYGVEAAARGYFDKSVTKLSLAQIAYICSIPNNPTLYNPFTNGENTLKRKDRILKQMYNQGDITKEEYHAAVEEQIVLNPQNSIENNYVETYAIYCATQALMKKSGFVFQYSFRNDNEEQAYYDEYEKLYNQMSGNLYTGGYKIYTSIDMEKQKKLQRSLDESLSDYEEVDENGIYTFQGSATCIDNSTGRVVAIVGGRTQNFSGYTLNRAYQSYRQPGSTIKPILVYTPAFENGMNPRTTVEDEPIEDGPVNSPDVYDGYIDIRYAVEKSKNTVAWELFEKLGIEKCISYLKKMNFHRIVADDYVLPMSIGGMTYGVSTLEMASAYATLENDGEFRAPTCIEKILDIDGNVLVDNTGDLSAGKSTVEVKQIYDTNAARMMTDVLRGVLTRGTGTRYEVENAICAAKTGTTNENKDVWLCGYSRYYTTAVWVGYDMPREISDGVGNRCAGYAWQSYMTEIHETLEKMDFEDYEVNYRIEEDEEESSEEETEEVTQSTTSGQETTKETQAQTTKALQTTSQEETLQETTSQVQEENPVTDVVETTTERITEAVTEENTALHQETTQAIEPSQEETNQEG